ncbi:hypothetical protein C8A03DRAFT_37191 [Achaetomium macrosporum]|uniref:Heterokaryon incompatibility domain-containing protein n=1 Tax=Achaetomium macrosporum TaxID=79813 RepID=A0AAN7H4S8_9PEZI|nr:hypothetical protein C8A03DRAFT_37191 [Achaetomium macrosporum]
MSRWHKPDCAAPNIVVQPQGIPTCLACGSTPDLDEIIRQQAQESPFPAPPPDEPRGQMHFRWPAPEPEQPFPIYPRKLLSNEFRLACLRSTADPNSSPIHLTLEAYPLSNCPPYETVSYCWVGEDGDSRRRCPVYVGPYWDVMLHTKNCWELLRFLRPERGLRLVWVDAVVVYLGPDAAPLLPPGRYPRRARLRDLGTGEFKDVGGTKGIHGLLQRRYFSRLWVVQELILSPRVVIRVGDIDFQSDGATSGNMRKPSGSPVGDSELSWVWYASRGGPLDKFLPDVIKLTLSLACADPRDRVFGNLWTPERAFDCMTDTPCVGDVYCTLSEVIDRAQAWLDAALDPDEQLFFLPRWSVTHRDLLNLYQVLLGAHPDASEVYRIYAVENLGAEFDAPDSVIFTIPEHDFLALYETHRPGAARRLWETQHRMTALATASLTRCLKCEDFLRHRIAPELPFSVPTSKMNFDSLLECKFFA